MSYDSENDQDTKPEHHNKNFRGWFIPASVVYLFEQGKLNAKEVLLLAMIDSLVEEKPNGSVIGCFASNRYLADKMSFSDATSISKLIARFKKMGLVEEHFFDGRKRYLFTKWSNPRIKRKTRKW